MNNPAALFGAKPRTAADDEDAEDRDDACSADPGDSNDSGDSSDSGYHASDRRRSPRFDTDAFLAGLDAIYDGHRAGQDAEAYLQQAMADAENAGDNAGLLTVLNETMGFYRSQGRHEDNQWIVQRALELGIRMGIVGSEAWTTTLVNAATAMRAARQYDQAEDLYRQALENARTTYGPRDRRLAALHNNLSMLYSETNRLGKAHDQLVQAMGILEDSGADRHTDPDIASTYVNLALVELELWHETRKNEAAGRSEANAQSPAEWLDQADEDAQHALTIYDEGDLTHSAHYASALAAAAQVRFTRGAFADAVASYGKALDVIAECYGTDTEYYRTTSENLQAAKGALAKQSTSVTQVAGPPAQGRREAQTNRRHDGKRNIPSDSADLKPDITGLQLARRTWTEFGKPLIAEHYPEYRDRIAAGLVGHGSECYGFDDLLSRDHDFGPGFCLWLTDEDYERIGERLQADYDALPERFLGFGPRQTTPRAQGAGRRVGVFRIGDFFESLTGYRQAPSANHPHEWLMLDEATLATATNGQVFADPLGAFSKTRQGFKLMPDDVRLSLISRRLGMISQAGQYNLPRMLRRGDGSAAWLSISEFADAVSSLVFLINTPISAGYAPYYKWRFAALRRLSARMGTRLAGVCEQLEQILRLSGDACYGEGASSRDAADEISTVVKAICSDIVAELQREGLTHSNERFLEWQRPHVEAHIVSDAACLHGI
ncbi:MAG: DUF4037 domain-containing protein [Bifidobacterium sp.]|uniref:DUF4037 domain-containing protein n=1 Tax=Bifidobacterium sp. TaxID=41200 RepID=UPI003F08F262